MEDTLTDDGQFICSRCWHIGLADEFAYIGPKDRNDTSCSPFMEWENVCHKCEPNSNG